MDYKKTKAPLTTVTRDLNDLDVETDNIYQTVMVASKRANQISVEMKQELNRKLEEFASYTDNLEEVFENPEQIEISRFFERLPFPEKKTLVACSTARKNLYFSKICLFREKKRLRQAAQHRKNSKFNTNRVRYSLYQKIPKIGKT